MRCIHTELTFEIFNALSSENTMKQEVAAMSDETT
jgi:hypothetical protein